MRRRRVIENPSRSVFGNLAARTSKTLSYRAQRDKHVYAENAEETMERATWDVKKKREGDAVGREREGMEGGCRKGVSRMPRARGR